MINTVLPDQPLKRKWCTFTNLLDYFQKCRKRPYCQNGNIRFKLTRLIIDNIYVLQENRNKTKRYVQLI